MARFVVDETCWQAEDLSPASYLERIEQILDTIDDLVASGHTCIYSDDLFTSKLLHEWTFYDFYQPATPISIPVELRQRVAAAFGRLRVWQELEHAWPNSLDVSVNGQLDEFAPSIAWAYARAVEGPRDAVPCIVHRDRRPTGHVPVRVGESAANVWMIASAEDAPAYFRWLIRETTNSPDQMAVLAIDAFPDLQFVPGAFDGIKDMSKPYRDLTDDLVKHLGALSDHGRRIFARARQLASAEFGALGVDLSDESGATKNNSTARRERTRMYSGSSIVFWWHTKLQPDRDRIHFCPDAVPGGGAIVIGIFCRHLT